MDEHPMIPCAAAEWHNILAKPKESLVAHTWHVLSRLADQLRLHPTLAADTQTPLLWHWLYWGTFLHDFGKCATGFQTMLKAPNDRSKRWGYRHEALSLAFVDWLFPRGNRHRVPVIAVIACHHKDAWQIIESYGDALSDYPEDENTAKIVAQVTPANQAILYKWLTTCGQAWAETLDFAPYLEPVTLLDEASARQPLHAAAIYQAVEDLRTYTAALRFGENPEAARLGMMLRGLIHIADHAGSAESRREPFAALDLPSDARMAKLFKPDTEPHPHQKQAAASDVGSAILIAPTGSGKTESALLWLNRQAELDGVPPARVFYILPYQASMNAMHKRLAQTFDKPHIGLQHGHAHQAIYYASLYDDLSLEAATASTKINEEASKLHRYPVNVQSPYQMLKAPYQLKGHEALFASFQGGRFILDEIHAYEAKRLALIVGFVGFLQKHANARFFIMSATMPGHVRTALQDALPGLQMIEAEAKTFEEFQRHRVHLLPGSLTDTATLDRICTDAFEGKSVLVCCNTVKQSKAIYALLKTRLPEHPLILVHSRFNGKDRLEKEAKIMAQVGVESREGRQGVKPVVVATQVVEVSLNIDMDTLYSEAAPLEALLQRFGRVNRSRPQENRTLADVYVVREQPPEVEYIYSPRLIDETLKTLEQINNQAIDESAVSGWLDQIYEGEVLEEWQSQYQERLERFNSEILGTLQPFATDRDMEKAFYQMFDGVEVLPADQFKEYSARIKKGNFVEAASMLVPLQWGQYKRLANHRKAWSEKYREGANDITVFLVDANYSAETGLDIESAMQTDAPMEAD